jgi:hypothetical protein
MTDDELQETTVAGNEEWQGTKNNRFQSRTMPLRLFVSSDLALAIPFWIFSE